MTTDRVAVSVVGLIFVCTRLVQALGPRCLECSDLAYPYDCDKTTLCGSHESCYTEQYVTTGGILLYRSGCLSNERCATPKRRSGVMTSRNRREEVVTCTDCCTGEFCNYQGCSTVVPHQNQRGPFCFACDVMDSPNHCRDVTMCAPSDFCLIQEVDTELGKRYRAGCEMEPACKTLDAHFSLIGRRAAHNYCFKCCDTDFCNDDCPAHNIITASSTRSTPSSQTTSATRLTTTTTAGTTSVTTTVTTAATAATMKQQQTSGNNLSASVAPATTANADERTKCTANGYTFFGSAQLCYKIHLDNSTWNQANATCTREGGSLVILDTATKWNIMRTMINGELRLDKQNVWIGAIDVYHRDHITWLDGSPITFNNWGQHQPDGRPKHDCVYLAASPSRGWFARHCDNPCPYVCGKQLWNP